MIRKIIDVDKKARQMTDDARSRRTRSAEMIEKRKEEVRAEYMNLARHRLDVIRQDETEYAASRLKSAREYEEEASARLTALAEENRAKWVEELVRRAIHDSQFTIHN